MVSDHGARAEPIRQGRELRAEAKFELPKLRGGPCSAAKWQARYGREPTDQQRAWLVNKVRTDIAMKATKLNAQVQLTNLQAMYERGKATSDQRRQLELEYQDWARLQGRGPHTAGGHGRNRHVGWQEQ